jgi:hypothetical protein
MTSELPMWVVFANPLDFPRHCVVRVQWASRTGVTAAPIGCLYDTVDEAMAECAARGLAWIGRYPEDEPQIVGVWV